MTLDDIELGRCTVHCCAPGLLGGRWKTRKYLQIKFYPVFIVSLLGELGKFYLGKR